MNNQTTPTPGPGPKAATPVPITPELVPVKDASGKVVSYRNVFKGAQGMSGKSANLDSSYMKYSNNRGVHLGEDLDWQRAENQSAWEKWGRFALNLAPNVAAGFVDMAGSMVSLMTEWETDRDYENALTKMADGMRDWGGSSQIFTHNPGEVFDPSSLGWWLKQADGLISSAASFAVGGAGVASLLGNAAKAITGVRAASNLYKLGQLAAQGTSAAALSYMEGAMEGRHVFEKVYNSLFDKYLAEGMPPTEARERAKYHASQGAASTVQLNTMLNTGLNILSLSPFFHGDKAAVRSAAQGFGPRVGETAEDAAGRIRQAMNYDNTDLAKIMRRQGMNSLALESGQESLEELNNLFAGKTGEELGRSEKPKGFIEQLGEIERWTSRTMNAEGFLSATLGAIGGVAQPVLMDRIPVHKAPKFDQTTGKPLTELDGEGNERLVYQRVSSRTLSETQHRNEFNSYRDALVADLDWYAGKEKELQTAVKAGNQNEVAKVRAEILQPLHRRYVQMGMGQALLNTYNNILSLDNTTPIAQQRAEELAQLKASPKQEDQDAAVALEQELQAIGDKTQAQLHGYADRAGDDTYKVRAEEAIKQLNRFQEHYTQAEKNFGWLRDAEQTDIVAYMANLRMDRDLQKDFIDQEAAEIAREEKELRTEFEQDPAAYGAQKQAMEGARLYSQKLNEAASLANEFHNDMEAIKSALLAFKTTGKADGFGPLVKKYGIAGATPADIASNMKDLKESLYNRWYQAKQSYDLAEQGLQAVSGYNEFLKDNPGVPFEQFSAQWHQKLATGLQARLNGVTSRKSALALQKAQWEEGNKQLRKLEGIDSVKRFISKAVKHQQELMEGYQRDQLQRVFQQQYLSRQQAAYDRTQKAHHSYLLERVRDQLLQSRTRLEGLRKEFVDKHQGAMNQLTGAGLSDSAALYEAVSMERAIAIEEQNEEYLTKYLAHLEGAVLMAEAQEQEDEAPTPPPPDGNLAPEDPTPAPGEEAVEDPTPVEIPLDARIDALLGAELGKVQAFIDGALTYHTTLPDAVNMGALVGSISAHLSNPKTFTQEEAETLREYITERFAVVKPMSDELRLRTLQTFLNQFNAEDADFLANQIALIQSGAAGFLDIEGFHDRQLGHMVDVLLRLYAVPDVVPQELTQLYNADHATLFANRDTLLKYMQPHVAGAFIRSQDRKAFAENLFVGNPVQVGLTQNATNSSVLPAPGIYQYTLSSAPEWFIDGRIGIVIDSAGPLTMQVGEDGKVWLDEDLKLAAQPLQAPVMNLAPIEATNNMILSPTDPGSVQQRVQLARMAHDEHAKLQDAFALATNTLSYAELVHDDTYDRVSKSNQLDKRANKTVLLPHVLPTGTELVLRIDDQYQGPQNMDYEQGPPKKVGFSDYLEDGKIMLNEYGVGNVPIIIEDANTGEVYGYLHRADWVTAQYPGASNFRNMAGDASSVWHQRERIMQVRQQLVEAWNAGTPMSMRTKVKSKGPGRVITNMEVVNKRPRVKWDRSHRLLPDPYLRFAVGQGTTAYVGKNQSTDIINASGQDWNNTALVILPMANGGYAASPLWADTVQERDSLSMLAFMELFLRHASGLSMTDLEKKHLQKIQDETGFDIRTAEGLRNLVAQFYTYTESFDAGITAIAADAEPGVDRKPRFLFNITDGGHIMAGVAYSGKPTVFAKLDKAGKLTSDFVETFMDGVQKRPKSIVFTDVNRSIQGVNSGRKLKMPILNKGSLRFSEYESYNDYIKSFTSTMVYGKHQVDGKHVYSANPVVQMDYTLQEPVFRQRATEVATDPVTGEAEFVEESEEQEEVLDLRSVGGEELEDFLNMNAAVRTIPGIQATPENLRDLRTFTPGAQRSVQSVNQELTQLQVDVVAPEHMPFIKCKA